MRAARAIADVTGGIILAQIDIAAPPERVFRALTDSAEIVRWWGSPDAYRTQVWTADLRVGGSWKADGRGADGSSFTVGGVFLEVDPPRRLVQTWKSDSALSRQRTRRSKRGCATRSCRCFRPWSRHRTARRPMFAGHSVPDRLTAGVEGSAESRGSGRAGPPR